MFDRRKRIAIAALVMGVLAAWGADAHSGAEAAHIYDTIAVRDVQAYRHVLEDDDRLLLVRYAVTETPDAEEDAYGASGAILKAQDGAVVLKQANPPSVGYALAAFYWDSGESSAVPWADTDVQVCIQGNPTLFASPQSHCGNPTNLADWNATSSQDETADELVADLPGIMQALELDDPEVAQRDYVTTSGITQAGFVLVETAFSPLASVAGAAFTISQGSAGGAFNFTETATPVPGSFGEAVSAGRQSPVARALESLGEMFGIPYQVMGLLFIVVIFGIAVFIMKLTGGSLNPSEMPLELLAGAVLLLGATLGAPPIQIFIIILILVVLAGLAPLAARILRSG